MFSYVVSTCYTCVPQIILHTVNLLQVHTICTFEFIDSLCDAILFSSYQIANVHRDMMFCYCFISHVSEPICCTNFGTFQFAVLLVMFNKAALSSYNFPCANVITLLQVLDVFW